MMQKVYVNFNYNLVYSKAHKISAISVTWAATIVAEYSSFLLLLFPECLIIVLTSVKVVVNAAVIY